MPTNDFFWGEKGLEIEVKKPAKAAYGSARDLMRNAVIKARLQGVVKDHFIIDLGNKTLTEKLHDQLAQYTAEIPMRGLIRFG